MRAILVTVMLLAVATAPATGISSTGALFANLGIGLVSAIGGTAVSLSVIGELAPTFEPRFAKIAVVVGSLTICGGLGGSFGVLVAGRLFGIDGNVRGCLLGGLGGGLLSAFTEPIAYALALPPAFAELLGFVMLPTLPAVGATLGYNR